MITGEVIQHTRDVSGKTESQWIWTGRLDCASNIHIMGLYQTVAASLNRATLRFRKVLITAEVVTAVVMFL